MWICNLSDSGKCGEAWQNKVIWASGNVRVWMIGCRPVEMWRWKR